MKKVLPGLSLVVGPPNARAHASSEAARPVGFHVGYVVGIAIFVYLIARMFGLGKKKSS
jgi:hypothetical protein